MMTIHTVPQVCAAINFWLLTDDTAYISDSWVIIVVECLYMVNSYFFYHSMGWIMYANLDYSNPELYWMIVISLLLLPVFAIACNILNALGSQAITGRWEWQGAWIKDELSAQGLSALI